MGLKRCRGHKTCLALELEGFGYLGRRGGHSVLLLLLLLLLFTGHCQRALGRRRYSPRYVVRGTGPILDYIYCTQSPGVLAESGW